ncbi:threonine/homoserine/homoserine lactone efflux protein [Desulfofundulus luciae]|uniref:Threonine/homoserine/homoserine lactone efflux protein n=2 Tax=Desulfofundulus luciae TaxID=74702 RepID=A0ABU0B4H1_9FIRM|nr:threonine/homoserine/homoserine lactone efflux protein [Desulfofundulus luciae]
MELMAIFSTAFVVGLSGAMMPGPLLTVTIGESARRGFAAGPLIVLGHALLEGTLVIALALGLASLLTAPVVGRSIAVVGGIFLIYLGWGMARDAWLGRVELNVGCGQPVQAGPAPPGCSSRAERAGAGRQVSGAGVPASRTEANACPPSPDFQPANSDAGSLNPGSRRVDPLPAGRMHPVLAGVLVSLSNPYWTLWWATVGLGYIVLSLKQGTAGLVSFFGGHILSDLAWYGLVAAAVAGGRRFLTPSIYRGILVSCGAFLVFLGASFIYMGAAGRMAI